MLRRAALVVLPTIALLAILTAATTRWLEVEDPMASCHAVVVLNGDQPARADEAARLHAARYAAEIWLTNDPWSGNAAVPDAGTVSNVRRLVAGGVPAPVIRVLDGQARGTAAELAIIRAEGLRRGASCLVVVTSPAHARRVKLRWERLATPRPRLMVRHAPGAGYAGWKIRAQELWLVARVLAGRD